MKCLLPILIVCLLTNACHNKSLLDVDENQVRLQKEMEKAGFDENKRMHAAYEKYRTCKTM